jgi:hypothetical protein
MVSAWASRQRLVLGQRACGAIPLLLERLALTGAPGAIDAMATQCRIAPAMREAALAGQLAQRQLRRRTRLRRVVDHGGVRHRREQHGAAGAADRQVQALRREAAQRRVRQRDDDRRRGAAAGQRAAEARTTSPGKPRSVKVAVLWPDASSNSELASPTRQDSA